MSLDDEVRQNLQAADEAERRYRDTAAATRRTLEQHPETIRRELRELARYLTARIKPARHKYGSNTSSNRYKSPPGVLIGTSEVLLPDGSVWQYGQTIDLRKGVKSSYYDLFLFGWQIQTASQDLSVIEAWPVRNADDEPNPHVSVHQMMVAVATSRMRSAGAS